MLRAVAIATIAVLAGACSGGGDDDESTKVVRQGASASVAGGRIWVVGGTEGPVAGRLVGDMRGWEVGEEIDVFDLDGNEVASVPLDAADGTTIMHADVAWLGDRALVVGGACGGGNEFGCGGPTGSYVAWVDLDSERSERIDVGGDGTGGEADLVGVAGNRAWVLVDRFAGPRVLRIDAVSGEVVEEELPPDAWTGDTCAGPDALVSIVAHLDEGFVARAVDLWRRPHDGSGGWELSGTVPLHDRDAGVLRLQCVGAGEVLLDIGDPSSGLLAVGVDTAAVLAESPDSIRRGPAPLVSVDPGGGLAVAWSPGDGVEAPAFTYRPGDGWTELRPPRVSWSAPPSLEVVDGRVVDVGGAAVVDGAPARELAPR